MIKQFSKFKVLTKHPHPYESPDYHTPAGSIEDNNSFSYFIHEIDKYFNLCFINMNHAVIKNKKKIYKRWKWITTWENDQKCFPVLSLVVSNFNSYFHVVFQFLKWKVYQM